MPSNQAKLLFKIIIYKFIKSLASLQVISALRWISGVFPFSRFSSLFISPLILKSLKVPLFCFVLESYCLWNGCSYKESTRRKDLIRFLLVKEQVLDQSQSVLFRLIFDFDSLSDTFKCSTHLSHRKER